MTQGKVALITAGGSGQGAAEASRLAKDGFKVAVLSSSGKGEALAKELGGVGVTGSNQSNDDLRRLVDLALERWGRVDALVNSAGHGPRAQIVEISDDDWHKGMDVYFLNAVRPIRLVTPIMEAQGRRRDRQHHVRMDVRTGGDVPHVRGLPRRARELLQNLRGHLCVQKHSDQQRAPRMDRQPARSAKSAARRFRWAGTVPLTR